MHDIRRYRDRSAARRRDPAGAPSSAPCDAVDLVAGSDLDLDQGAQKLSGDHRCVSAVTMALVRLVELSGATTPILSPTACALSVDPVRANE
jgi:hypothetical protein